MSEPQINLEAEVARVRGDLISFRDLCLPAFFEPGGITDLPMPGPEEPARLRRDEWRLAADRLIHALPVGQHVGPLDLGVFDFLHERPEPRYSIEHERIVWWCGVGVMASPEVAAEYTLAGMGIEVGPDGDPVQALLGRLREVERWLLGLPADGHELPNTLCMTLPLLVDADPEFVRRALDTETWWRNVLDQPGLSPEERARKLRLIDSAMFRGVLNNALLHVLGAAASNHFDLVLHLLGHPNLRGGYTDMKPHYLVGVLLAKVRALRFLAGTGDEPGRRMLRLVGVHRAGDFVQERTP